MRNIKTIEQIAETAISSAFDYAYDKMSQSDRERISIDLLKKELPIENIFESFLSFITEDTGEFRAIPQPFSSAIRKIFYNSSNNSLNVNTSDYSRAGIFSFTKADAFYRPMMYKSHQLAATQIYSENDSRHREVSLISESNRFIGNLIVRKKDDGSIDEFSNYGEFLDPKITLEVMDLESEVYKLTKYHFDSKNMIGREEFSFLGNFLKQDLFRQSENGMIYFDTNYYLFKNQDKIHSHVQFPELQKYRFNKLNLPLRFVKTFWDLAGGSDAAEKLFKQNKDYFKHLIYEVDEAIRISKNQVEQLVKLAKKEVVEFHEITSQDFGMVKQQSDQLLGLFVFDSRLQIDLSTMKNCLLASQYLASGSYLKLFRDLRVDDENDLFANDLDCEKLEEAMNRYLSLSESEEDDDFILFSKMLTEKDNMINNLENVSYLMDIMNANYKLLYEIY